jgi:Flp pilus assembly protein TadD
MVMFPVAILLYVWWRRGRIGLKDAKASAPFFLISLALGLLTVWLQPHTTTSAAPENILTPPGGNLLRLVNMGLSLSFYFSKCFLPVGLLPIYPQWTVDPSSPLQFLPWLIVGGAVFWLWTKREDWGRHALLGLGFFLVMLLPFTAVHWDFTWVMDHFLYIPIIGLIGLAVAALGQMENRLPASFRFYGMGLVSVVLALLALKSHSYAKMFINEEMLWTYELRYNPDVYVAHNNLGLALARKGRLSEAMGQFAQALQLKADDAEAHNNLGLALFQTGRTSKATEQYEQALQINPDYADARYNLANALLQADHFPEAIEQYQQALRINPDYVGAHNNLGVVLYHTGRVSEAVEQFEQVARLRPNDVSARNNLTRLQALQKNAPAKN